VPIHLTKCDHCPCRFRLKDYKKPYVGMYKDKPVFHWYYFCPKCFHVHTVQYYNEFLNTYYDNYWSLRFELIINRKKLKKYDQILIDIEIAEVELKAAIELMKRELVPMRKI
jgi:hypothetical protein